MTDGSSDLVEHLEDYLGRIDVGWTVDADGAQVPFQVARFDGLVSGGVPFATIGLSRVKLRSSVSGKRIRQEFVFLAPPALADRSVPGLLQQVGREIVASGTALLRGDVIGPRGRLFEEYEMEALYSSNPVYFPDDFAICGSEADGIVMVWLIPITKAEARFVAARGWSTFENKLQNVDPDLVDFSRPGVVAQTR